MPRLYPHGDKGCLINGLAFLERIRKIPAWSDIPVVILTELAEKELVLRARELKVREYSAELHELMCHRAMAVAVPESDIDGFTFFPSERATMDFFNVRVTQVTKLISAV